MQSSEDIQILGALPALFNSSRVTLHRLGIEKGGRFRKTLLLLISPRCPSVPTAVCPCGLQGTKRALHPLLPMWCTLQQGERSETCSSPHLQVFLVPHPAPCSDLISCLVPRWEICRWFVQSRDFTQVTNAADWTYTGRGLVPGWLRKQEIFISKITKHELEQEVSAGWSCPSAAESPSAKVFQIPFCLRC